MIVFLFCHHESQNEYCAGVILGGLEIRKGETELLLNHSSPLCTTLYCANACTAVRPMRSENINRTTPATASTQHPHAEVIATIRAQTKMRSDWQGGRLRRSAEHTTHEMYVLGSGAVAV